MTTLIADIGGTHSRLAVAGSGAAPAHVASVDNARYSGVEPLLRGYLATLPAGTAPRRALLAVAAPIHGDHVTMINIGWQFSCRELTALLELERLEVMNDFKALAYALPHLDAGGLRHIGEGRRLSRAARVVLGPGTGLGVAGLVPAGESGWVAVDGEGGHVTLPASNDHEARIIDAVRRRHGHCSAERLVSGPGLTLLHEIAHDEPGIAAAEISRRASAGDAAAVATLNCFFELLGTVAADAALTFGATGGVYIGGGIVPRNLPLFLRSGFRERFAAKGRYGGYLGAITTQVIIAENPALTGLANYLND